MNFAMLNREPCQTGCSRGGPLEARIRKKRILKDRELVQMQESVPPRADVHVGQKIPRVLLQTFKDNLVGLPVAQNTQKLLDRNPEYSYMLYTDERAASLIRDVFPPCVHAALLMLETGAAKGDLIRYCLLYAHGGVYLDMDSTCTTPLRDLIGKEDEFFIGLEPDMASPVNWAMAYKPYHPYVASLIRECVRRVLRKSEGHIFDATGPNLYSDVLIHILSGALLKRTKATLAQRMQIVESNTRGMPGKVSVTQGTSPWRYRFSGYDEKYLYGDDSRYRSKTHPTPHLYTTDSRVVSEPVVARAMDSLDVFFRGSEDVQHAQGVADSGKQDQVSAQDLQRVRVVEGDVNVATFLPTALNGPN